MLDGLRRLIELQRIDDELAKLEAESAGLPGRLAEARQTRESAEQQVAAAGSALQEAEHERRQVEAELADKEAHLAHLNGQTTQVKTNEAYTALLHEMDHDRAAISDCETRILELMDEIDSAATTLARLEGEQRAVEERVGAEERAIEAREEALGRELARAREERAKLAESIDAALIRRYDGISKSRTPAIAIAASELCLGCRVRIPPQAYNDVILGESIVACGSCHRILVHEALLREPAPQT